jgi:hypothetical protein
MRMPRQIVRLRPRIALRRAVGQTCPRNTRVGLDNTTLSQSVSGVTPLLLT